MTKTRAELIPCCPVLHLAYARIVNRYATERCTSALTTKETGSRTSYQPGARFKQLELQQNLCRWAKEVVHDVAQRIYCKLRGRLDERRTR